LKPKHDEPLWKFPFNFKLRRYSEGNRVAITTAVNTIGWA
jgi:hypothetical protein